MSIKYHDNLIAGITEVDQSIIADSINPVAGGAVATLSQEVTQRFNNLPNLYAPAGYGWGELNAKQISWSDIDTTFKTGLYWIRTGTAPSEFSWFGTQGFMRVESMLQSASGNYLMQTFTELASGRYIGVARRYYISNQWYPLEWLNPPLDVGVEYRTTERYQAKPVYVKLVGAMNVSTAGAYTLGIGASDIDKVVSLDWRDTNDSNHAWETAIQNRVYDYISALHVGSTNQIMLKLNDNLPTNVIYSLYFTVKYTKTTD